MDTRRHDAPRTRCTLCLTCINSVLRPDHSWRCAVPDSKPRTPWECDHHVHRFRHLPIVERRRGPRV